MTRPMQKVTMVRPKKGEGKRCEQPQRVDEKCREAVTAGLPRWADAGMVVTAGNAGTTSLQDDSRRCRRSVRKRSH